MLTLRMRDFMIIFPCKSYFFIFLSILDGTSDVICCDRNKLLTSMLFKKKIGPIGFDVKIDVYIFEYNASYIVHVRNSTVNIL